MGMRCYACSLTPILAVAGLLGLGAAGYRVASGGCPMCHQDSAAAKLVSDSRTTAECPYAHAQQTKLTSDASGCCAGMSEAECKAKMAQCPGQGGCCPHGKTDAPEKVASTGK